MKRFLPAPSLTPSTLWLFLKINLLISALLYLLFMSLSQNYTLPTFLFTLGASLSSIALLYLLLALVLLPFLYVKQSSLYLAFVFVVVLDVLILADFFIFRLYKMHINPMVLNIILSPAAQESVHIGIIPTLSIGIAVTAFVAMEIWLLRYIRHITPHDAKQRNRRSRNLLILPLVLIVVSEKITFGVASLQHNTAILQKARVIPLYLPLTFNRLAKRHFGYVPPPELPTLAQDSSLQYPLNPLKYTSVPVLPHIFIFGSDATRADMLTQEIMPHLHDFAKTSLHFTRHYSGGNTTRFGLFSLFYGLNATYWFAFLNEHKGSLLFDALLHQGYALNITNSTDLRWPEFRQTAFVNIQNSIIDAFQGVPWEKDRQSTDAFKAWLDQQDGSQPLFSFVFFDAPHGPYSYPKKEAHFLPDNNGVINYMTVSKNDAPMLLNMYKNANRYVDGLFQELFDALKAKGIYEKAIIIVTSDHGEEFFENGNFGHNSSFSDAQTNSFLIVKIPGMPPQRIDKLSSHVDIVPFLMKRIGVSNPCSDYANGVDLLEGDRKSLSISNWNNYAIKTKDYVAVFSKKPSALLTPEIRRNRDYSLADNVSLDTFHPYILQSLQESSAFFK